MESEKIKGPTKGKIVREERKRKTHRDLTVVARDGRRCGREAASWEPSESISKTRTRMTVSNVNWLR